PSPPLMSAAATPRRPHPSTTTQRFLISCILKYNIGARVLAAVSSPEKAELALANGADGIVETLADDLKASFRAQVARLTDAAEGRGVDLAIDVVGGDVFEACLRVLKFAGRLVVVGFSSSDIPAAKTNYLLYNNLAVIGAPLDINFEKAPANIEASVAKMQALYGQGKLNANIMRLFPLEEFKEAFRVIESRTVRGKIVLTTGRNGAA
ncbi:MAG: zinc-binding dehydrogenase, partial [Rhodospirillales bacterium]|nr:zinc-binding dehydrogenase [Rhodospirillales bacterium]